MGKKIRLVWLIAWMLLVLPASAQVPTVQDCLGAIPICQDTFTVATPYPYASSNGNYLNEINAVQTCIAGENNGIWYIFTVQTSGNFSFIVTPANGNDDYDWSLFNITNNSCADIGTALVAGMAVSSNTFGTFGFNGPTGASTASGGTGNCNGPGFGNGPIFNADVVVSAGETYVLYVSNWSNSTFGYTIDFSGSTAVIFDNVPPAMDSVTSPITCLPQLDSITLAFTENILCSSVQTTDFTLTGPGGPYTVNATNGPACATGGDFEKFFTLDFSPAITTSGTYTLNLVGASGFVEDLCGNIASAHSIDFVFSAGPNLVFTPTDVSCFGDCDGSVAVTASGGTAPITYDWSNNLGMGTQYNNLCPGSYTVTVTDGSGCTIEETLDVLEPAVLSGTVAAFNGTSCSGSGSCDGMVTIAGTGGTAPYQYSWPNGMGAAINNQLCAGTDEMVLIDVNNCTDTVAYNLFSPLPLSVTGAGDATICISNTTPLSATGFGGTLPYAFTWSDGQSGAGINVSPSQTTTYTVSMTDGNNCPPDVAQVEVTVRPPLTVQVSAPDTVCPGDLAQLTASAQGGDGNYVYSWLGTNGESGFGQQIDFSPNSSTIYTVALTDGCGTPADSAETFIQVGGYPDIGVSILGIDTLCRGDYSILQAVATGGFGDPGDFQFTWSHSLGNRSAVLVEPDETTTYTVTVSDRCASQPGAVSKTIALGDFSGFALRVDVEDGCAPLASTMEVTNFNPAFSYRWRLDGGDAFSYAKDTLSYRFTEPGCYGVAVELTTDFGCVSEVEQPCLVQVFPNPTADFTLSPDRLDLLDPQVAVSDISPGNHARQWHIDGVEQGNASWFEHVFADTGKHEISLQVTSSEGCTDAVTKVIWLDPANTLYMPNAFSPNQDGWNEQFGPEGEGLQRLNDYKLLIFNRWGEVIFKTDDPAIGWDGRANGNGEILPYGVYTWLLEFSDVNNHFKRLTGSVVLIRDRPLR